MKAIDFEYDGIRLSNLGYMICTFDGPGQETYSTGSQISFTTTPVNNGRINYLTGYSYDECISAEFQICKGKDFLCNKNGQDDKYFTVLESRALSRWLNRSEFLPLMIIDEGYENTYFEGSFNVSKIEINGRIVGFDLVLTTNRPFALHQPFIKIFTAKPNQPVLIRDESDEIGSICLDMQITCKENGTLIIANNLNNLTTVIKNCSVGEKITLKNFIISTSNSEHQSNIMNDFNFVFPRISNTFKERNNKFTFSISCDVRLSYSPVRKVGI